MLANITPSLLIGLAGAAGTLLRYWVGLATLRWGQMLPWGTILINVTGSFAIAFFGTLTAAGGRLPVSETGRLVFMVGLCGGYTTFSSFSLQTLDLLKNGAPGRAMLNIGLSVGLCMLSVTAGYLAAQAINTVNGGES
ncbi:MAG: CrcB family protein [Acetobacter syzygii]|uniref:CrcB family protein n=1 Tax=Acetobacter syzygii TaxID=146476 RepID=UPI0005DD783E|nr:CrcB family protein [Acetobacter syzygii]NSL92402.1 CrcB family protein [Acetobacter syzygii]GAN71728.1 integral membrane protein CrcB [Acetobacter syzygii]GBR62203.1 integral membrane protein CrcB [Acetobacter syzygii NRIC 0483]GEL56871.1 putative fluoride ion transporter CrcB [Acetobacter syzygii]